MFGPEFTINFESFVTGLCTIVALGNTDTAKTVVRMHISEELDGIKARLKLAEAEIAKLKAKKK